MYAVMFIEEPKRMMTPYTPRPKRTLKLYTEDRMIPQIIYIFLS